jgi:GT2 family glycosyltransferase
MTPATNYREPREIFSASGAATLYRREFLERTGGFDRHFFAYLEDVDLGLRGRLLGYRYLYLPDAKVLHKGQGSSLPHPRYVELITRNRLKIFAKNIPLRLLLRHAPRILLGQIYFMLAYGHPWSSLKAYASMLKDIPDVLRERREILGRTRLHPKDIDLLLHRRPPWPPLRSFADRLVAGRHSDR